MGKFAARRSDKIGWLAYHVESRSIDEALITDIQFDLIGKEIPVDHGYALYLEIVRMLPWFSDEPLAGIHPIHGAELGQGKLILNRRAKLTLRIPAARESDFSALTGQRINIEGDMLEIGRSKIKPLSRHTPLFAHCVATGSEDEVDFANDIIQLLDDLEIDSRFICGKRQSIKTQDGMVSGFSLMLHGLPVEHSLLVQQQGLGKHRKIGCGIFIPHKSITALT